MLANLLRLAAVTLLCQPAVSKDLFHDQLENIDYAGLTTFSWKDWKLTEVQNVCSKNFMGPMHLFGNNGDNNGDDTKKVFYNKVTNLAGTLGDNCFCSYGTSNVDEDVKLIFEFKKKLIDVKTIIFVGYEMDYPKV
jgi:hypothetical protein